MSGARRPRGSGPDPAARRLRWRPAATLAVALVAAACGGDGDEPVAATVTSRGPGVPASVAAGPATTNPASTNPATTNPATTNPASTNPASTNPASVPDTAPAPPGVPAPTLPAGRPPTVADLLGAGRVLNLAHAGGDQDHPHSTMYAYRESVAAGADVLELDVRLTADGHLVVQHDETTGGTADQDLPVAGTELAALQALDNAYWWSPQCWPCRDLADDAYVWRGVRTGAVAPPPGYTPDDFRILTVAELAAAFPDLPFDIEIKGAGELGLGVAEALADLLVELDRVDSTVVASFDDAVIEHFHALAPDVAVSPGVNTLAAWLLGGAALPEHYRIVQVPPFYEDIEVLTPEHLAVAAGAGVAVWVWPNDATTQENEAYYRELVAMGVDGIIAGRPAEAARAIRGTG